ncbi:hypothetical protein EUTSA_v10012151mg [Eutrema salsugineum]|uniref:Uncharacterized protein n=1 Tax=Eutrema salsugineum TaxID=72664 RepID=V4JZS4_EUTSA|nr:hypothetical protein EUTSA_v10012151mg [Eutrema salsugineum]
MDNPSPLLSYKIDHRLEQHPDAKDLMINVEIEIIRAGQECDIKRSSFSFSAHEFVKEGYNSLNKEKLYYFLIESGIEDCDTQFMINDMILSVCLIDNGLGGVLTVLLNIRLPSIDPISM